MKRSLFLAVAALAVVPAVASANVGIDVNCDRAEFSYTGFRPNVSSQETVKVNGAVVSDVKRTFSRAAVFSVPLGIPTTPKADYVVEAKTVWWTGPNDQASKTVTVTCGTDPTPPTAPEPPQPPPVEQPPVEQPPANEQVPPEVTTPVVPTPPVRPRTDCAYLRQVGAGRRWLVKFGCVRRITCADVPRGAGIRWYNGSILGYRCPLPPGRVIPPPRVPVVAG